MSNQTAKRGLSVKDLVTIGIFTALMLVFSMVGGIFFAPNPVLTFYMPVGSAILCGPIYLLLIAKVKKRFAITIVGALIGIIWFVTGMHWAFALGTILMGIVADLVAGIGGYASRKINAISYMLYSLGGTGSYLVFFADPDGWAKTMLGNGTEQGYIDTMQATGNSAILAVMLICFFTAWIMQEMTGTLRTMFVAFLGLLHKVYACGMLAGVVLTTTKVSEFLSAMNRLHAPKKLVIPLAVMLRYLPTVGEDWRYIKDAMRMRDVFPSVRGFLTAPGMTVECIYVPFMMAASKAADELSIAAVTRGIENPKPRTCLVQIRPGITDAAAVLLFLGYFAAGLYLGRSI